MAGQMLQTKFIENEFSYDGSQLHSLFAYLNYKVLGDSTIAWVGPCDISLAHMVDGEDLLEKAEIRGSKMLHFITEIFHQSLLSGVALQRLFASIVSDTVCQMTGTKLTRSGDDLYLQSKKLSISIAALSNQSCMIHFAVNISNEGTPVPTLSLGDLGLNPKDFADLVLKNWSNEYASIKEATVKVKPLN